MEKAEEKLLLCFFVWYMGLQDKEGTAAGLQPDSPLRLQPGNKLRNIAGVWEGQLLPVEQHNRGAQRPGMQRVAYGVPGKNHIEGIGGGVVDYKICDSLGSIPAGMAA